MDKPTEVQEEYYFESVKAIKAISEVLSKIVPGMELDITDLGKRLSKYNLFHYFLLFIAQAEQIPKLTWFNPP